MQMQYRGNKNINTEKTKKPVIGKVVQEPDSGKLTERMEQEKINEGTPFKRFLKNVLLI